LQHVDEDERLVDRAERPVDQARVERVVPAGPGLTLLVRDRDRSAGSRVIRGCGCSVARSTAGGGPDSRDGPDEQKDEKSFSHLVPLLGRQAALITWRGPPHNSPRARPFIS